MDLKFVTDLTESRMYRSKQAFKRVTAREVCDLAFMDMISIWILYNEFETAPTAIQYANRTVAFNRFDTFRQMSTDLYLELHVITEKRTDLLDSAADITLLERINLDVQNIVRYLRHMSSNSLNQGFARQTLQRIENALYIENSNYRSVRRLAQSWPTLSTAQKRTVLTRIVMFYKVHGIRSELYQHISALAKGKNLLDPSAKNPEINPMAVAAIATAAGSAGYYTGYRLGKSLSQ